MKTKKDILKSLFVILSELESGTPGLELKNLLSIELNILYNILGEDVPEEYWERIERLI